MPFEQNYAEHITEAERWAVRAERWYDGDPAERETALVCAQLATAHAAIAQAQIAQSC